MTMNAWTETSGETKKGTGTKRKKAPDSLRRSENGRDGTEIGRSDLYQALTPIYRLSRACGLFPVTYSVSKTGKANSHLHSPSIIYGIFLIILLMGAMCWGLWRDLHNGWENSTRLSSETAILVTCSDVMAVISVMVIAIIGSPFRWKHMRTASNKLIIVDEKLSTELKNSMDLRKVSIIIICCTYVYLAGISIYDYLTWEVALTRKKSQSWPDKGPANYSPIYLMYVVIMTFEIQYAMITLHAGQRFAKLNSSIEELSRINKLCDYFRKDLGLAADPAKDQTHGVAFIDAALTCSRGRNSKLSDWQITTEGGIQSAAEGISQLITLQGILCDGVVLINKAYGAPVLLTIVSCLIHLIITPYFLYTEMFNPNVSWRVVAAQVTWCIFHSYRLLLLVQPCYIATAKAKKTGSLISQSLSLTWDTDAKNQLEIFSLQLLHRPVEFTACDMFALDRSLVTSIAGAVTTYLVILIQFQSDEGKPSDEVMKSAAEIVKNASLIKLAKS